MKENQESGELFKRAFWAATEGFQPRLYQSSQILELVGESQILLSRWIARGFIKPTVSADGPGTRNYFNEMNVCQILLFKELNTAGFKREDSSRLAFQPKIEAFFALELARLKKAARKFAEWSYNVLEEFANTPLLVLFSPKEDGTIETDYILTKKDFETLPNKLRQSKMVIMPNLSYIARQVHQKL